MREHPEYAPRQHPFRHATLFVDSDSLAAQWQRAHTAPWLEPITTTPQARWLTGPADLAGLDAVAKTAASQATLLVLVAYFIPDRDCAGAAAGAADATAYGAWIGQIITALSTRRAVIVLEPDAVAADCFDDARAAMLAAATRRLAAAGHYVYLDAGHPRWHPPEEMAPRLRAAGIAAAQGFAVNVSNRQSTDDSQRFAAGLSTLVGGREAIIDVSRNGLGAPPDDQWCNPARQGLGQPPSTRPGLDAVAALLWIKRPGESDGRCGTETSPETFSPRQAQTLIVNAPWVPDAVRRQAARAPLL
jgi:endoglucanase